MMKVQLALDHQTQMMGLLRKINMKLTSDDNLDIRDIEDIIPEPLQTPDQLRDLSEELKKKESKREMVGVHYASMSLIGVISIK
jgi:hypothetical protein